MPLDINITTYFLNNINFIPSFGLFTNKNRDKALQQLHHHGHHWTLVIGPKVTGHGTLIPTCTWPGPELDNDHTVLIEKFENCYHSHYWTLDISHKVTGHTTLILPWIDLDLAQSLTIIIQVLFVKFENSCGTCDNLDMTWTWAWQ